MTATPTPNRLGNYDDDAECEWTIECEAEGTVAILEFDEFETESDYDYVKVSLSCKPRTVVAPSIPN